MIRFSKYIWLYFLISGLVLIPGIFSLIRFGLTPSIDFTGGTILEIHFDKSTTTAQIMNIVQKEKLSAESLQFSASQIYILRFKPLDSAEVGQLQKDLTQNIGTNQIIRDETVGPILGTELLLKAVYAAILAVVAILLYVAYAFKNFKFGVCAILALFHDLLVVLGSFSLFGHFFGVEVDTLFVTAFLTTMSFSVHDTIIIFDRIREYLRKGERRSLEELSDAALTETLNRSLTNSLTLMFMLLALALMGGITVRWFIVALLIGTTSGAYSSPFVATPLLILWDRWERRKK